MPKQIENKVDKAVSQFLQALHDNGIYRIYPEIDLEGCDAPYGNLHLQDKVEKVVIWGNNNYLNLSNHPEIIKAKTLTTQKFGAGSGGTRNVLGTSPVIKELEDRLAKWTGKQAALVHNSALDANMGVIAGLAKILDVVFVSDGENHASIIDGIKLSGAEKFIFKHNDLDDLESKIEAASEFDKQIVIIIESIYSMSGDFAKLKEICDLKEKYNAILMVDEVHANGLYGEKGGGVCEEEGLLDKVDIIIGTFGKALGLYGGYVACNENLKESLRHTSRNFIYSTAMAPDNAEAVIKSIEIVQSKEGESLRKNAKKNSEYLKAKLSEKNIDFCNSKSHIIPIIIGDEEKTKKIAKELLYENGIAVTPLFYPTVEMGKARLRIVAGPYHNENLCEIFVDKLSKMLDKYRSE